MPGVQSLLPDSMFHITVHQDAYFHNALFLKNKILLFVIEKKNIANVIKDHN